MEMNVDNDARLIIEARNDSENKATANQQVRAKKIKKICSSIAKNSQLFANNPRMAHMGDLVKVLKDLTDINNFMKG